MIAFEPYASSRCRIEGETIAIPPTNGDRLQGEIAARKALEGERTQRVTEGRKLAGTFQEVYDATRKRSWINADGNIRSG